MSKGATTSTAEINPDLLAMYKEVYSGAKSASEIDFLPYESELTAGFNPDQLGAFDYTRGAVGQSMGYNPRGLLNTMGTEALDISPYQNIYQQEVIDASLNDLERARQIQQIGAGDRAAQASAFGGSRHGVLESEADRAYYDAASRMASGLRAEGFDKASQLGLTDRDYKTGVQSGLLSDQYRNIGLLSGIGAQQQALQQAGYGTNYDQYLRSFDYPARQLNLLTQGVSFLPSAVGRTDTRGTGFGDVLGAGAGLLGAALSGGYFNS